MIKRRAEAGNPFATKEMQNLNRGGASQRASAGRQQGRIE